jgi:hypothetical protein
VDKRFANPNSAVHAKNQAAIDAGRSEIETGHLVHSHRPPPLGNSVNITAQHATPQYGPQYGSQYGQQPPAKTAYGGLPVSGSQIEGRSGGKLNSFMKKMKEGAIAPERSDGRTGGLKVVNE